MRRTKSRRNTRKRGITGKTLNPDQTRDGKTSGDAIVVMIPEPINFPAKKLPLKTAVGRNWAY